MTLPELPPRGISGEERLLPYYRFGTKDGLFLEAEARKETTSLLHPGAARTSLTAMTNRPGEVESPAGSTSNRS
jgi:hypothetical protein